MGLAQRKTGMTADEFIAWEDAQPDKHEFLAGEVLAMVGARRAQVGAARSVFYPRVLVTCHPDDPRAETVMHHPKVIIEVLSDSTAAYDRGEKFAAHRRLDSPREDVLIDPDRRTVEVFRRMPNGDWLLAASDSGQGPNRNSLAFTAPLAAVFEDAEPGREAT